MAAVTLLLFCFLVCFQYCDGKLLTETMRKFNMKCKRLKLEILYDADRKVHGLQYLRKSHEYNYAFQLGTIAANIKLLYVEVMRLYIKMEQLPQPAHQLKRCEHLIAIQRMAMEADSLITMLEDTVRRNQKRSHKGKHINNLFRRGNGGRVGRSQKTSGNKNNSKNVRAVMKNISNNKEAQAWPQVQQKSAASAKRNQTQDDGGFEYSYDNLR